MNGMVQGFCTLLTEPLLIAVNRILYRNLGMIFGTPVLTWNEKKNQKSWQSYFLKKDNRKT